MASAAMAEAVPEEEQMDEGDIPSGFWDVEGYRIVGKRISDTSLVMDELIRMANERVALERKIAKMMQQFSNRWEERFAKMPPWTLGEACKGICSEATALAAAHVETEKAIMESVIPELTRFRAVHYAKSFGSIKVIKESMRGFERASKAYNKTVIEAEKQKKIYYERQAEVEKLSAMLTEAQKIESANSESECKKLTAKVQKALVEARKAEGLYKKALDEGKALEKTYEHDMRAHFAVCQDQHRPRLQFLKDSLEKYVTAASISTKPSYIMGPVEAVKRTDTEGELKAFADSIGVNSSPPPREFVPWKAAAQAVQADAAPGKKLQGAWFVKAGETAFSLSHNRFFVLDGKELRYYASCDNGVPAGLKGQVDLNLAKEIRSSGREIHIQQEGRVWKMFGKKEDETARWANLIASACGLTVGVLKVDVAAVAAAALAAEMAQKNASATKIQAEYRGYRARKDFQKKKAAAVTIQSHFRGFKVRKEIKAQNEAAAKIQAAYRDYKTGHTDAEAGPSDASQAVAHEQQQQHTEQHTEQPAAVVTEGVTTEASSA